MLNSIIGRTSSACTSDRSCWIRTQLICSDVAGSQLPLSLSSAPPQPKSDISEHFWFRQSCISLKNTSTVPLSSNHPSSNSTPWLLFFPSIFLILSSFPTAFPSLLPFLLRLLFEWLWCACPAWWADERARSRSCSLNLRNIWWFCRRWLWRTSLRRNHPQNLELCYVLIIFGGCSWCSP